eukprot:459716-Prymnesium_polylepis.2
MWVALNKTPSVGSVVCGSSPPGPAFELHTEAQRMAQRPLAAPVNPSGKRYKYRVALFVSGGFKRKT